MTDGQLRVTVNDQGRVVLPAELRRQLGFTTDVVLVAYVDDGRLVLETPAHALRRARDRVSGHIPDDVSLADELIAERRRDAARDAHAR